MPNKFEAFEGQVVFFTTFQSLESLIVREAIDNAIPEHRDYPAGSQLETIYINFRYCLSSTDRIEFHLKADVDDDLKALQTFWKEASKSTDYGALWPQFRKLVSLTVHDIWNDAINAGIPRRLLAPAEVWPSNHENGVAPDPNEVAPVLST